MTYQTAALSRGAALLLAVGAVIPFVAMVTSQPLFVVPALICFLLGWFLLGVQAIRLDRPATDRAARPEVSLALYASWAAIAARTQAPERPRPIAP